MSLGQNFVSNDLACRFDAVTGNLAVNGVFVTRSSARGKSSSKLPFFFGNSFLLFLYHGDQGVQVENLQVAGGQLRNPPVVPA